MGGVPRSVPPNSGSVQTERRRRRKCRVPCVQEAENEEKKVETDKRLSRVFM